MTSVLNSQVPSRKAQTNGVLVFVHLVRQKTVLMKSNFTFPTQKGLVNAWMKQGSFNTFNMVNNHWLKTNPLRITKPLLWLQLCRDITCRPIELVNYSHPQNVPSVRS